MLKVNVDGKSYQVKNNIDEFLIKDFEVVTKILNDDKINNIEKWSEVFIFCGLPRDIVDMFDLEAFIKLIKEFNLLDDKGIEMVKDITLNDITYTCYQEEFRLTVKDTRYIEDFIVKNPNNYLGELMAIVYKRTDVDKNITYDSAHIKYKAELFRNGVTADKVIPFIQILSKKLINDYELLKDGTI